MRAYVQDTRFSGQLASFRAVGTEGKDADAGDTGGDAGEMECTKVNSTKEGVCG
jgi:hypothetical protein